MYDMFKKKLKNYVGIRFASNTCRSLICNEIVAFLFIENWCFLLIYLYNSINNSELLSDLKNNLELIFRRKFFFVNE